MRTFKILLGILMTFIVTCAWADVLPRPIDGGKYPRPPRRTQDDGAYRRVRPTKLGPTVSELNVTMTVADVQVHIKKMTAAAGTGKKEPQLLAEVTGEFDLKCTAAPPKVNDLAVVFPLAYADEKPGGPVRFAVTVDGKPVPNVKADTWPGTDAYNKPRTQWGYGWRLTGLKAGQTQRLAVRYSFVLPQKLGQAQFIYFLRSGALWHAPIGREVVKVTADPGLQLKVLSPTKLKPAQQSDSFLLWRLTNARPAEDVRLSIVVPDTSS